MATYTAEKGAILQPGNQINRLSSFNTEGVYAWPGLEFYELVGYFKVDSTTSVTSGDLIVPSPDRRSSDRVRDDRTSMVIQASTDRPAYIYSASIALGQDIPAAGEPSYPASPITADLVGTNTEIVCLKPASGASRRHSARPHCKRSRSYCRTSEEQPQSAFSSRRPPSWAQIGRWTCLSAASQSCSRASWTRPGPSISRERVNLS